MMKSNSLDQLSYKNIELVTFELKVCELKSWDVMMMVGMLCIFIWTGIQSNNVQEAIRHAIPYYEPQTALRT